MSLFADDDDAWGGVNAWGGPSVAPVTPMKQDTLPVWDAPAPSSEIVAQDEEEQWSSAPQSASLEAFPPSDVPEAVEEQAEATPSQQFDDFDDFATAGNAEDNEDDDGFGDFEESSAAVFQPVASTSALPNTRPLDFSLDLQPQIQYILSILYPDATQATTDKPEREISDPTKDLLDASSSKLLQSLSEPAPTQVVIWKRSKIRRLHLQSLGIQVKQEEVVPVVPSVQEERPSLSVLKTNVHRSASPRSAPPASRSTGPISRTSSPSPAPVLDRRKADALLALDKEALEAESVETLKDIQASLEELVRQASEVLTIGVEQRERLRADSETYDQMIQDLVTTAQKLKPSAGTTSIKRTSSLTKNSSNRIFGARAGSPNPSNSSRTSLH